MKLHYVVLLVVAISTGAIADEPVFRSAKALDAQKVYAAAAARAESEYTSKILAAEKAYVNALTVARRASTMKNDVDEALRIETEMKSLQAKVANDQQQVAPTSRVPLAVESAILYAGGLMRDVTKSVQKQVHGDSIQGLELEGPDLRFGAHKYIILKLRVRGQIVYTTALDDGFNTFVFGGDLGPEWKRKVTAAVMAKN